MYFGRVTNCSLKCRPNIISWGVPALQKDLHTTAIKISASNNIILLSTFVALFKYYGGIIFGSAWYIMTQHLANSDWLIQRLQPHVSLLATLILAYGILSIVWKSNLTPDWNAVFCCPLWLQVSNLFDLQCRCWVWSEDVAPVTTPNSAPCTSLQQGERINHWRSAKTGFSWGVKLLFKKDLKKSQPIL